MAKVGKRLKKIHKDLEAHKVWNTKEAISVIKQHATAKFDETIDVVFNLNVDTRKADQSVRGMVSLPHGTGKTVRVAVFARDDKAQEALKAGADLVGAEDLVEKIQKGELNFDRCIATPDMMVLVGRLGKILGTRGLMPNPKLGTVTPNVGEAVRVAKAGQVEYRAEKAGIIHAGIGKASFSEDQLSDNLNAFANALIKARPQGVKGIYIKSIYLSSTMGSSVQMNAADFVGAN